MRPVALACLLALAGCGGRPAPRRSPPAPSAAPEAPPARRTIDVALHPVCDPGAPPRAMDVRIEVDSPPTPTPPAFRIGGSQSAEALGELIEALAAVDASGPLALTPQIRAGADRETRLFFDGDRPTKGKLAVTYRVRSVATDEPGIRFGLRHDTSSIGGTGDGLLVLPVSDVASDITVRWAIDGCDAAWSPATAMGVGVGPHAVHAPPDSLRQAGFFFGRPVEIAHDAGSTHLRFFLYGGPVAFDAQLAARYTADILRAERALFADEDPTPFYAFMRVLPELSNKVNGGGNSYGYTSVVGPAAEWSPRMRNHLAHELMHHWIGVGLWVADARKVSGYWFTEGFTVRYARTVALRAGAIGPDEALDEINRHAKAYYGSAVRGATNAEIERGVEDGAGHPDLGLLPYYKGAFYAEELDGAIRARSGGKRSLDDLVRELLAVAKTAPKNLAGYAEVSEDAVRAKIVAELGDAGGARFDAVVRHGEIARPDPDAMGPCFARKDARYGDLEGYAWERTDAPDRDCAPPATR